jgi:hypothetical protein
VITGLGKARLAVGRSIEYDKKRELSEKINYWNSLGTATRQKADSIVVWLCCGKLRYST